jgi:APA family basic amino acid/polyamine antiporter
VPRRRRQQRLERVLGTPALFATAYGNVGSSIYYALGLVAGIALGLTPLVFVISGLIFAATAATYAEGTVRFPEAGGSSSFARHAFDELVSFGAAWAQMLNYVITIAISAFFVPHYLSIFWSPLKDNPWDIIGGVSVIALLVLLNIVGLQESAKLNLGLALIDFGTQVLLVLLGFFLVFSPSTLAGNIHWGTAPPWRDFALAIPVAMIAYTGIETVSNLAEETRDPEKNIPSSIRFVAIAVFAIYFTLPAIALSALPVKLIDGELTTKLALTPDEGGFQNDPVLGVVENLGISGTLLDVLKIYVGILAATILLIATNAGVIGASRITYAMAHYRQLPEIFRRLHPRFKTPWLSLLVFAGGISIVVLIPGQTDFLSTMYSFGAMLSFTVAHASVTALRVRRRDEPFVFHARPNLRLRGVEWPLFALFGGAATFIAWLVVIVQTPDTRYAGLGWLALGFFLYVLYRRRLGISLHETVRAPAEVVGAFEYRTIVVPVVRSPESEEALITAARVAAERRATVAVVTVVEVPLALREGTRVPAAERDAHELLDSAQELVESYGVRTVTRLLRGVPGSAGERIVEDARRRNADLIVVGEPRRGRRRGFGRTVDYILREAHCPVLIAAGRRKAA